jgi:hypothetical protein
VVGNELALAFFATWRLAKQFLQAMAGVESMTVAINPADNSLIVVIELLLWMQQTTRDYLSRIELVWLRGAAIVNKLSRVPHRVDWRICGAGFDNSGHLLLPLHSMRAFNMHSHCQP